MEHNKYRLKRIGMGKPAIFTTHIFQYSKSMKLKDAKKLQKQLKPEVKTQIEAT